MPDIQADVLVANILAGPLMELAPRLTGLITPQGSIALSGILAKQTTDILSFYDSHFSLSPPKQDGDWIQISGSKKS